MSSNLEPQPEYEDPDCFSELELQLIRCDRCLGTGLAVEGWDCEACGGEGGFEA